MVTIYVQENYFNELRSLLDDLKRYHLSINVKNLLDKKGIYLPEELIVDKRGVVFPLLWQQNKSGILFPPQTLTKKNLLAANYLVIGDLKKAINILKTNDALASYILNEPRLNSTKSFTPLKGEDHYYKLHSHAILSCQQATYIRDKEIIRYFNKASRKSPKFEYQNFTQLHCALALLRFGYVDQGLQILSELSNKNAHEEAKSLIDFYLNSARTLNVESWNA